LHEIDFSKTSPFTGSDIGQLIDHWPIGQQPKLQEILPRRTQSSRYAWAGGFASVFVIPRLATAQLPGIAGTVTIAMASGVASGFVPRATGAKQKSYEDELVSGHCGKETAYSENRHELHETTLFSPRAWAGGGPCAVCGAMQDPHTSCNARRMFSS
jgi:hypothetical protein